MLCEDYRELWRSSGGSFPAVPVYTPGYPVEVRGPGQKSVVVFEGGSGMSITSSRVAVETTSRAILDRLSVIFAAGSRSIHTYTRNGNGTL